MTRPLPLPPPPEWAELAGMIRAYQRSRALTLAAQLGIADRLVDGPRHVEDLAAQTGTQAGALYRLLRALASVGVFREEDGRRFALSPSAQFLRRDHPLSLAAMARFFGADYEWRLWGELGHSVATGEPAWVPALGMDVWDYRRQSPQDQADFDAAMEALSKGLLAGALAAYDFSRHKLIADIAGGTGALLAGILAACPGSRGVLFDQPQVVAAAAPVLAAAGVTDRVDVVAGDFFAAVPAGADAYVLCHILHDWLDAEAERILRTVREAMPARGTLLILDAVVGPPNTDPLVKFLDLHMLASVRGIERTEPEWRDLLGRAGFDLVSAARTGPNIDLIEARPQPRHPAR